MQGQIGQRDQEHIQCIDFNPVGLAPKDRRKGPTERQPACKILVQVLSEYEVEYTDRCGSDTTGEDASCDDRTQETQSLYEERPQEREQRVAGRVGNPEALECQCEFGRITDPKIAAGCKKIYNQGQGRD